MIVSGESPQLPPPPSPEELQPHFSGLEITRLIGQGGMGAVYEAQQPGLRRTVALKILRTSADAEGEFESRFAREGRTLAQLSHQHIVTIYDAGRAGPYYFIVMEYVDGCNLRHLMQQERIEPAKALAIVAQVCTALEYAHGRGVVHRDIKPDNVLLTQDGQVKIADFGIAKLLGRSNRSGALTGTYQAIGTPQYMAPEQINHPKEVDHRADIYALGVLLYEVLTGELPVGKFQGPSRRVDVDSRVDDIVAKAMQSDPERRYQAASDLKTAVANITSKRAPARGPAGRRAATPKRSPWLIVAAVAVVAGAIGWLAYSKLAPVSDPVTAKEHQQFARQLQRDGDIRGAAREFQRAFDLDSDLDSVRDELVVALRTEQRLFEGKGRNALAALDARRIHGLQATGANELSAAQRASAASEAFSKALIGEASGSAPGAARIFDSPRVAMRGRIDSDELMLDLVDGAARLEIDGKPVTIDSAGWSVELTDVGEGRHQPKALALYGDKLAIPIPLEPFVVDLNPPVIAIREPVRGRVVGRKLRIAGTLGDATASRIQLVGEELTVEPGHPEWSVDLELEEGTHELKCVATDALNRTREIPIQVIVDETPPVFDLLGQSDTVYTRNSGERFEFAVIDANLAAVTCDGKEVSVSAEGRAFVQLRGTGDDGQPRYVKLEARDKGGLTTPRRVALVTDKTAPTATFDAKPGLVAYPGLARKVSGSVTDMTLCRMSVAREPEVDLESDRFEFVVQVPEGLHTGDSHRFAVSFRDAAGNSKTYDEVIRVVEKCADCAGTGDCRSCTGTGVRGQRCPNKENCRDGQILKCPTCKGRGLQTCERCNGERYYWRTCPDCEGGTIDCKLCESGRQKHKCPQCDSQGIRTERDAITKEIRRRWQCGDCEHGYTYTPCLCAKKGKTACRTPGCKNGRIRTPCELKSCKGGFTDERCSDCNGEFTPYECGACHGQPPGKPCGSCRQTGNCSTCEGTACIDPAAAGTVPVSAVGFVPGTSFKSGKSSGAVNATGPTAATAAVGRTLKSLEIRIEPANRATLIAFIVEPNGTESRKTIELNGSADVPANCGLDNATNRTHWKQVIARELAKMKVAGYESAGLFARIVPAAEGRLWWNFEL